CRAAGPTASSADRRRAMPGPARVNVPVDHLTSAAYADRRRAGIDPTRAQAHTHGVFEGMPVMVGAGVTADGTNTTHMTVIDDEGTIVSATQTLQSGFGSRVTTPGTGMLLNNHMSLMDPTPGNTNSIEPGKRILSSMS